ncbi:hypothetical protein D3C79_824580 [compost metagenome]
MVVEDGGKHLVRVVGQSHDLGELLHHAVQEAPLVTAVIHRNDDGGAGDFIGGIGGEVGQADPLLEGDLDRAILAYGAAGPARHLLVPGHDEGEIGVVVDEFDRLAGDPGQVLGLDPDHLGLQRLVTKFVDELETNGGLPAREAHMLLVAVFPLHGDLEEALSQVVIALPALGGEDGQGEQPQAQHPADPDEMTSLPYAVSPWIHVASLQPGAQPLVRSRSRQVSQSLRSNSS